jgi:hypothetical protein
VLYAGGAALSVWCLTQSSFATHRLWGEMTWAPYSLAAAIAAGMCVSRRSSVKARTVLAVAVSFATLVLPLIVEIVLRDQRGTAYARSEVFVTEQAATHVLNGDDPYTATFTPMGQTHFPYLPLMPVFGFARALWPGAGWADARVFFALTTIVVTAAAVWLWPGGGSQRLRVLQFMLVLPPGTLLLVAGGDDLPVVALCLLAVVLLHRGQVTGSTVALAAAALMKFTAWPLLLALPFVLRRQSGRAATSVLACLPLVLMPAILWHTSDFVDDTVLFPLGLSDGTSGVRAPTFGSELTNLTSEAGTPRQHVIALLLLVTAVAVAAWYARRHTIATVADATQLAGVVLVLLVALAPVARPGYAIYPLNLLLWGYLLREPAPGHAVESVRQADAYAYARAGS